MVYKKVEIGGYLHA